ncbi:MAG TPA: hypothetical protein VFF37_17140 [Streptomyces sp.]|nr:hypothetical protein [Streptomyces sp.]
MTKIRRALAVAAATASAVVLASSPASAAPNWQPWVPPANYKCGPTTPSAVSNNVIDQTCIAIASNGMSQAILLVRNNSSVSITIDSARTYWYSDAGTTYHIATCEGKVVAPGELTACYGFTSWNSTGDQAQSYYLYNGVTSYTDRATL